MSKIIEDEKDEDIRNKVIRDMVKIVREQMNYNDPAQSFVLSAFNDHQLNLVLRFIKSFDR